MRRYAMLFTALCALAVSACQTTGASRANTRGTTPPAPPLAAIISAEQARQSSGAQLSATADLSSPAARLNAEVAALYDTVPEVILPARIALARAGSREMQVTSEAELAIWRETAAELGEGFGEFLTLSPVSADMAGELTETQVRGVVADVRRAAALQKADYVLLYSVATGAGTNSNVLDVADLTIIGLWVAPSRNVNATATAEAILLDVRTGYVFGAATAQGEDTTLTTAMRSDQAERGARKAAQLDAVEKLANNVKTMALQLAALAQ